MMTFCFLKKQTWYEMKGWSEVSKKWKRYQTSGNYFCQYYMTTNVSTSMFLANSLFGALDFEVRQRFCMTERALPHPELLSASFTL